MRPIHSSESRCFQDPPRALDRRERGGDRVRDGEARGEGHA